MNEHVYLVRSVLAGEELVERKDDIVLLFDSEPSDRLVAARLACVLLGVEPQCTDIQAIEYTRIS